MFACHVDAVEAFGDTAVVAVAGAVGGRGKGKRIFTEIQLVASQPCGLLSVALRSILAF